MSPSVGVALHRREKSHRFHRHDFTDASEGKVLLLTEFQYTIDVKLLNLLIYTPTFPLLLDFTLSLRGPPTPLELSMQPNNIFL